MKNYLERALKKTVIHATEYIDVFELQTIVKVQDES